MSEKATCESCGAVVSTQEPGVLVLYKPDEPRRAYCPKHSKTRPKNVRKPPPRRGWPFIKGLDRRLKNAATASARGTLFPWERQQIMAGDYSPLIRELDPDMEEGKVLVISWERSKPYADPETGAKFRSPARPALWITVTSKVRRAKGGWSVRYDVDDTRDKTNYMRRVPPAQGADDATEEEAALASSYTTDSRVAVEPVPVVPHEDLKRFAAEARVAGAVMDAERVEEKLEKIGELPARDRIVELHKLASDRGVDVRDDVKAFERRLLRRLGKAA